MNRREFDRRVKARGNGPGQGTCLDRFSLLNEQQRATVRDFLELIQTTYVAAIFRMHLTIIGVLLFTNDIEMKCNVQPAVRR